MPKVIHFEMAVADPERAIAFYSKVFGWKVQQWEGGEGYWLINAGAEGEPGADGAFMLAENGQVRTVNTLSVESLEETVAAAEAAGGKVEAPRMAVPGVGWFCYLKDTEGNTIGVMQLDKNAK